MNGRAATYYREQQTLEASIVLRDLLAFGGNDHEQTLRRCALLAYATFRVHWLSGS